ncbi:MAG: RDD family protein [Bacteroidales bacterium]|nr:RDD family protein [Bacteroidales bacterium]
MRETVLQMMRNAAAPQWLEREISFVVDMLVCIAITVMPKIGFVVSVVYFLLRDSIPVGHRSSLGKSVYGLRVVMADDGSKAPWRKVLVRNVISFIPFVNIYDVYLFLLTGDRLADQWSGTKVVKMSV